MILKNVLKGFLLLSFMGLAIPSTLIAQAKKVATSKQNKPAKNILPLAVK